MTEEQLLREAKLYGAEEPEELTYGELVELLELGAERERRFLQGLALVAYRHAALTARALAGRELPSVGEAFPFWTEEELRAAKLERCRRMMERRAVRRGREEDGNESGSDHAANERNHQSPQQPAPGL